MIPMTRAFTLVETIVVVALTSLVGLALFSMIAYFYRSNAYVLEATSAVDSASRGLNKAVSALREASFGEDGAYPLTAAATSTLTFYADIDSDYSVERVRLYLSGGKFYQGTTNAAGNPPSYTGQPETTIMISDWVKNPASTPVFRYFDEDGTELTGTIDVGSIRSVQTTLDVDINPQRAPNILRLEGSATVRNLRDE